MDVKFALLLNLFLIVSLASTGDAKHKKRIFWSWLSDRRGEKVNISTGETFLVKNFLTSAIDFLFGDGSKPKPTTPLLTTTRRPTTKEKKTSPNVSAFSDLPTCGGSCAGSKPACTSDGKLHEAACTVKCDGGAKIVPWEECKSDCITPCPKNYSPTCSSDGTLHSNECLLMIEMCKSKGKITYADQDVCCKHEKCKTDDKCEAMCSGGFAFADDED